MTASYSDLRWRKSARSGGTSNCVEAALVPTDSPWRKSARSASTTDCVEASTDGLTVAVQNSKFRAPEGPMLTVAGADWLAFLDQVTSGNTERDQLSALPATYGPFALALAADGWIELRCADEENSPTVRYTASEWDTFTAGVRLDGEFGLDWLLAAPATTS